MVAKRFQNPEAMVLMIPKKTLLGTEGANLKKPQKTGTDVAAVLVLSLVLPG